MQAIYQKFGQVDQEYKQKPEFIQENEKHKIPWDFEIQTDKTKSWPEYQGKY